MLRTQDTAGSPGQRPAQRHTDLGSGERPRRFWGMGKRRDRTSLTPTEREWREGTLRLPESSLPGPAFPRHPHLTLRCPWRVSAAAREPQVHFLRLPWEGLGSPQAPGAESAATPRIPATQGPAPESPPRLPCAPLDGGWGVPRRKSKSLRRPEAVGVERLLHAGSGARAPSGTQTRELVRICSVPGRIQLLAPPRLLLTRLPEPFPRLCKGSDSWAIAYS